MLGKIWILVGAGSLLGALALLLYRAGFLIGHPIWFCGLILSILLSCGIIYLSFRELLSREKNLLVQISENKKEAENLRNVLEEAHVLYRDKVEKLEQTFALMEEEQEHSQSAKDKALNDLKSECEIAKEESNTNKNHTQMLHNSLEDALDEVRGLRQFQYMQQEVGKTLPKDLPSQHRQLREQFDEKALILEQTRRRLFLIEGQLLALKKQKAMESLSENPEESSFVQIVQNLIEENEQLEKEIGQLEILVARPLQTKRQKKSQKNLDHMLELQFEPTKYTQTK